MNKTTRPLNTPFDISYTITFSGRTKSDGVPTVTGQMIRDKIIAVLEDLIEKGHIRDYTISAMINNIETAKKTISKSRRE